MVYRAIGLMSGSSLDGLDIVFAEFDENRGNWSYNIIAAACYTYSEEWHKKLSGATELDAYNYLLLHAAYGKYLGEQVTKFIDENNLHHQVQLIASHGHTTFHAPHLRMTAQLGEGAAIAAVTGINVISDLRAIDVALGGEGAPIVPIGEKLLFNDYTFLLNIGGIANLSYHTKETDKAFDVCAANKVLNMLANDAGKPLDRDGEMARSGSVHSGLLTKLNHLEYFSKPYPKSLPNSFGIDVIYPLIKSFQLPVNDALRTFTEHISLQTGYAVNAFAQTSLQGSQLLITGGGAHNKFLVERIKEQMKVFGVETILASDEIIDYKEALIMALLGVLRWREENTVLSSVTGAVRDSIGGAVWIGQEA
ncbi:MAG: anhydro-N-acetylmuramic acid kinase [Ilyomonas sp.]